VIFARKWLVLRLETGEVSLHLRRRVDLLIAAGHPVLRS
jgi:hypothetical protein